MSIRARRPDHFSIKSILTMNKLIQAFFTLAIVAVMPAMAESKGGVTCSPI